MGGVSVWAATRSAERQSAALKLLELKLIGH